MKALELFVIYLLMALGAAKLSELISILLSGKNMFNTKSSLIIAVAALIGLYGYRYLNKKKD
jgi:hypothetical protein